MLDTQTAAGWRGHELIDRDGDKIGTIESVYVDRQTDQPEWLTVKTGLFGSRQTFVPIRDATSEGEIVRVPFEKSHVKDAPNIDPEQELSQDEERELYQHYGVDYDTSGTQLPQRGAGAGQEPMASAGTSTEPDRPRADAEGETTGEQPGQAGTAATAMGGGQATGGAASGGPATGERSEEAGQGAPVAAQGEWQEGERAGDDDNRGEDRSPSPEEGERGVAVPGESDADEDERSAGERSAGQASAGERSAGEQAVDRPSAGEQAVDQASTGDPRSAGGQRVDQGPTTERVSEEPAGGDDDGETRLRLKRYVVTEEVRVPVQREEVRVEREE
jgi:hypothetical protein